MPIKYNLIERGEPGITGGGNKKWYAVATNDGELTVDDLTKQIEKFSALSEADIRGVIIALENVIQDNLANGKIIRLDKLGSFYPTLSSKGADTEEDFDTSYIRGASVRFLAGTRISNALKTTTFKKNK